jgi:hypothetical protein
VYTESPPADRVVSFESSGGYFSGDGAEPVGPATHDDAKSFETDELEGLAEDRVVTQGYLLSLKNVSSVRQWKRRWIVLRGKSLTMYKNFEVPPPHPPPARG